VTESRAVTVVLAVGMLLAGAIALLELNPDGRAAVRLSLAQWRHVERVVRALGSLGVPAPRTEGS
jgi:hypothetical protein